MPRAISLDLLDDTPSNRVLVHRYIQTLTQSQQHDICKWPALEQLNPALT